MRLGIDLDGVVANFSKGWIDFYNRDFGTNLTVEQDVVWDGLTTLTHFDDMDAFWEWTSDLDGRSVFRYLDAYPGAVAALQDLHGEGHEIVILTTKPGFAVVDTYEWIADHGVPASEIHILEDKWRIDCDVYLDDGPHVLTALLLHRPERVVCRYVRPWNEPLLGAVDITGFDDFRALIERLQVANRPARVARRDPEGPALGDED